MSSTTRTKRGEDRAARYLEAARALFVAHGYEGTSTDMIVARVGGSKATLYRYFPSKEALVDGLIAELAARAAPPIDVASLPLERALEVLGRATLDAVVSEQAAALLRLCLGALGRFPKLAETLWRGGPALTYARFITFLEARRATGEVDFEDAQLAAEHFLAGIAGHIQLKVAMGIAGPPDEAERGRRVAAAVAAFTARYATRRPRTH